MRFEKDSGMKNGCKTIKAALHVSCRETSGEDGDRWFQTFPPYGRYPVGGTIEDAKEGAEFVIDEASAREVMDAFAKDAERADWPGVLVDREHFSTFADKPSDAMAWARGIRQAPDGSIWTRWDFTPEGERLWGGRVLVSRSPYFAGVASDDGMEVRPVRLISIGMTNTPHFTELSTLAAARAADAKPEKEKHMDKIIEALGLQPDATEEDVLGAVNALKEKASAGAAAAEELKKERDDAVAECRAVRADAFLKEHAAVIGDAAACREVYLKDPELAGKMVAACRAPAPAKGQQILAPLRTVPAPSDDVRARLAACRTPQEMARFAVEHARELADAGK